MVDTNKAYMVSNDVIARDIEGEIVIVPLMSGIGDMDDDLYSLNETGKIIWKFLEDENLSIKEITEELSLVYDESYDTIETQVKGIVQELLDKGLILEQH